MGARTRNRDCLVVGGGPAGLMAAVYLKRFHRDVLVVDAGESRTRYIRSTLNCPGFPGGISGDALMARLHEQCDTLEVEVERDRVKRLDRDGDGFVVEGERGRWRAPAIVAACGVVDTLPHWSNMLDAIGAGVVRLCAVCDAYEVEDQRLAVYGSATDCVAHACFLRTYSQHVTAIVPPGRQPDAQQRALAETTGVELIEVGEHDCRIDDRSFIVAPRSGAQRRFDAVYVALGARAQTGWLEGLGVLMERDGEVRVDASGETSVSGIYAIGDAVSALNQISVAFGHAAIAATAIHNRLPRNLCA